MQTCQLLVLGIAATGVSNWLNGVRHGQASFHKRRTSLATRAVEKTGVSIKSSLVSCVYDLRLLWTTHLSLLHYTPKFAPIRGGDKSKRRTATGRIGGHAATHPLDPHMRFRAAAAPFLPPHAADHSERRSDRRSGLKSAAWVGLSRPEGGGLVIKPAVDPVGP